MKKVLNYFFINDDLQKHDDFIKSMILYNFPQQDIDKIKENLKKSFNKIKKIYNENTSTSFFLKLNQWPSHLTSFDTYLKMNFILNIINASLQYCFWITPGFNSRFNSSTMHEIIQKASDIVLNKYSFLSLKKYEKLVLKQIKINLLKVNNVPWMKERFETIEFLEKYGVHLKNPVFLNDFYRKKQFFAIYLISKFINYLLSLKEYNDNSELINLQNKLNKYLYPVIDYRIPQALFDLGIFEGIRSLNRIKNMILNYNIFIENEKDEFILRGYSYITMQFLFELFKNREISYSNLSILDSSLFIYAKKDSKMPHHYCKTTNY